MKLLLQHTLFCALAFCQIPQPAAFETASVKAASADSRARASMRGGPDTPDAGLFTCANVTLSSVLLRAFGIQGYRLTGPDWLSSRRYDIIAKVPPGATKEQFNHMLQNLLIERFRIALHHETKAIQGYELAVGRNGSKLKPSLPSAAATPPPSESGQLPKVDANGFPRLDGPGMMMMEGLKGKAVVSFLTARAQTLSALAEMIGKEFRLPIVDKTGLAGTFDFTLEFAPQPPGALPAASVEVPNIADDSAPNLITAVQQQLGLRLNPAKISLDVLIVDRADPVPVEN